MTKRIILQYADGSIGIRGNVSPSFLRRHGGDVDAALRDIMDNYIPRQDLDATATVVDIVLPERDYLRNSWMFVGGSITFDMAKARGLHMDEIRQARNTELVKRDITFMRAIEAGDTSAQAAIATEKQVLRDIPATFDITTDVDTPEKLKAKWPTELPG